LIGKNLPDFSPHLKLQLAVVLLWRYGLIHLMVTSDRTYISSVIAVLYLITSCIACGGPGRSRGKARAARRSRDILSAGAGTKALDLDAGLLPAGLVTDHIRSLWTKANAQATGRIDQTLLLRSLADRFARLQRVRRLRVRLR